MKTSFTITIMALLTSFYANAAEKTVDVAKCEEKIRASALANFKAGRSWAELDSTMRPASPAARSVDVHEQAARIQSEADSATAEAIGCLYE